MSAASRAQKMRAAAAPIILTPPPPQVDGRRLIGVPVVGRDLAIGDVILFLGGRYPIDRFEPYTGSLLAELGEGTRIARSGTWGMTVGPNSAVRIAGGGR